MHFTDTPDSGQIGLQLKRLMLGYDGVPLLPPITQTVSFGQRVALVGPNGIGKTTLFKTLLGETPPLEGGFRFQRRAARLPFPGAGNAGLRPDRAGDDPADARADQPD